MAAKLGNRTDNMCARRWRQLSSATDVMTQYSQRVKKGALKPNTSTRAMRHKRTSIAPEVGILEGRGILEGNIGGGSGRGNIGGRG